MAKFIEKLKKLLPGQTRTLPESLSYEETRSLLETPDTDTHKALAARQDVKPEILYYLASDPRDRVRAEVARNPTAPRKSDLLLADDEAETVRAELARKISKLLPDESDHQLLSLREHIIELLEKLAQDQATHVRQIIAEELKNSNAVPHKIVKLLAHDEQIVVAGPILEYSPLLSDDDLKEVIALSRVKGALTAIAKRASVSADIADGIAAALDVPAVAALLANPHADIREETLSFIIDNAAAIDDWHAPLTKRPNLSLRLVRRIATFVASSLVQSMTERLNLDPETAKSLLHRVRERIKSDEIGTNDSTVLRANILDLKERNTIDEKFIIDTIDRQQREILIQALSILTDISTADVEHILTSRNPRRIVAMAWRAGLSMRTAFRIQADVAHVPHRQLINARDGFDYPFTPVQMQTFLNAYTI